MGVQVVWHDGASAASETARVHEVYSREYPPGPDFAEWRDGVWARHRARPGFDLGVAESDGRVAGIAWAYVGERGQYWTDAVTASLPDDVADRWVGGHLEIVELIVLPEFRRHGLGTALLTALLARSSAERALLSVNDSALPARSLYRSLGWQELGPLGNEMTVMGTSLRGATP
ncbi:GNAT family N-acetyltransferase [uncultured Leifsonia sp.]|uniref:GNAT family N-acetyltransferase n=1 Tax=uncultured Leifsonia sp. TaxID=340359 RepID=UPI0028CFFB10|nr:GNAT family N-acetyltransferase [uncultured Leifsonia sp.]